MLRRLPWWRVKSALDSPQWAIQGLFATSRTRLPELGLRSVPARARSSRLRSVRPIGSWRQSQERPGSNPTLAAAERGAIVALANKETLVCAGALFMRRAVASGATILPVDSEHNAVFQAMSGSRREDIRRVILTASGGPFRTAGADAIRTATVEQALKHPNWSMGRKVTVDSATMMNKGLELIEAHHLFQLRPDQIDVLVHPQSIVHSLVEYCDGSLIAQLGSPDMRIPIAYCLAWPARLEARHRVWTLRRRGR